jgi:hypothetical protein
LKARLLLIAYALVNAVLYSVLLPLWEGFDEPFHFGYVQQLGDGPGLPDARTARLSREVEASILLAPASQAVKQNLPQVTSYTQYFSWPVSRRSEARHRLRDIPTELRWQPSELLNYEAHQPPLAYMLLAVPARLLAHYSLPVRVAMLRIIAAVAGSLLLLSGAEQLFQQLDVRDPYKTVALFCLLSCQMVWATLAHIGNDWLAVPIAVWALVALNILGKSPGRRSAAVAAVALAAGLLTKAYFLSFVPLLVGLCVVRKCWHGLAIASVILCGLAGPWYARNLVRYGVLTGTQEARAGIGLTTVLRVAPINWPTGIWSSIRASLWTGNNSFLTFSANTLNLIIATSVVALLLWVASRHAIAEWITLLYCSLFVLALGYAAIVSHIYTHGAANGPSPWYAQVILAPLLGLALLGAARWPRIGRFVAALVVLEFGYVLATTYAVKLIPLYGGYDGRTSMLGIATLYSGRLEMLATNLDTVALAPAAAIFALAGVAVLLAIAQQVVLIQSLARTLARPAAPNRAFRAIRQRTGG